MHRIVILKVAFFVVLIAGGYCDFETLGGDNVEVDKFSQETLFVSLGSYCAPASLARSFGLRKAAFPFDWNISLDGEKLIDVLKDDFLNFLDEKYLVPFGSATLLNTYYHLEFVHDGTWEGVRYSFHMPILLTKYKRRIERFKSLKEYQGKVYFIRAAYTNSTDDKHRFYKVKENVEITEDYAIRLYEALKEMFSVLDFCLIIINNHDYEFIIEEKRVHDNLLMVRAHSSYTEPTMMDAYKTFFEKLL